MGAMQNNGDVTRKKSKSRGSVNNSDRLEAFARGKQAGGADWGSCSPERLQSVIVGITAIGGAVTFGLSRDLGAHSLTLLLDSNRKTLWFNGDVDLDEELDVVHATLEALVD